MRILVVEDETRTAAYLRKGLAESGFAVDLALQDREGLGLACKADYDLIVLDALLPSRDGWSILSGLRRAGKQTPVLFVAPRDTADARFEDGGVGGDCLLKPFAFSELLAQVRTTLRRDPAYRPGVLRIGDLEIDWIGLRASRAGRRLDLTHKEFLLLCLLARSAGKVLSRALIADQVWGINFDPKTNVVDVHVRRLRSKVDDPFETRLIHTVRGMGYVLEDRAEPRALAHSA
jgi:two-component system, OmpR family, copper resistance phosphate regulon response regulator CusR